jgi:GDP-4-dehydro-6-deoxy-D-mannose reductase
VVNVASGVAVSIRSIIEAMCAIVGVETKVEVDETLVRADDPAEVRGDATLLRQLTGWTPGISLHQTLADVLAEAGRSR